MKQRQEVAKEDQWDLDPLYLSLDLWHEDFKHAVPPSKPRWPVLAAFQGRLEEGPAVVNEYLEHMFLISRQLGKLFTYAHLEHDVNLTNDAFKNAYSRATAALHDFHQETSWFEPELIALPEEVLEAYLNSPLLSDFHFYIEKIVRIKKHTLSKTSEELLAMSGKALQAPGRAFTAMNNADFKFEPVLDGEGTIKELTHASYSVFIRSQDRVLREHAFRNLHQKYSEFENALSEILNGQIQSHVFHARARRYDSCLEAALFPKNIDIEVYPALIQAVHDKMSILHKYVQLRKKVLGVDELHLYDLYVPLTKEIDITLSYQEAEDAVIESVAPLGTDYQNILKKGLKEERWADRYENLHKISGAYSNGCYDSMPYILMNYKGTIRDVFTLAHEAGHSMHSYLSRKHQPCQYADYPIFLAEVASTFNEELLMQLLLKRASSKEEKIFLINQKIEDIRTTLFRQTMFAEFELKIHEMAESDQPLTPATLKNIYLKLNAHYFGNSACIDQDIGMEWARIPHFYYNFYVFQYATGISAALTLAEKVLHGNAADRDAYLSFLKGGSSLYPIDLLKKAGVDMRSPEPVQTAISRFGDLTHQLAKLMEISI
jgi:oligoendopeptidase F